jgi:hypothetical protein
MSEQIETFKKACLNKWTPNLNDLDERLRAFEVGFEQWLTQIPATNRPTVLTLIENLEYYSHKTTNAWLKTLHLELVKNPEISDENTIYVFIKSKYGKTNSSNDYWTEYKAINQINKNICIENMDALDADDWQYIQNIVFIDDFSGSGKSFIDELKKNPDRYSGKNVFFITINSMILAIEQINAYCSENNIHIVLLSAFTQEKAFERNMFDDNSRAKDEIRTMSKDFQIPKNEIFGYQKGQALIAFYNNTPNNTLGFIRYDTETYKSLFPRRDDPVPTWMKLKKDKMKRSQTNYANKVDGTKGE